VVVMAAALILLEGVIRAAMSEGHCSCARADGPAPEKEEEEAWGGGGEDEEEDGSGPAQCARVIIGWTGPERMEGRGSSWAC
jgi:hypothetical protein